MSAVNAFEDALLDLLFLNIAIANIGDATGLTASTGAGSTQLSLHSTALSDTTADLTVNQLSYTGYGRQTQPRSASGWDSGTQGQVSNAALEQFGNMTAGGPVTAVHVGCGLLATGDVIRLHADLAADLVINNGINPQFAIGALVWTLD